MASTTTTSTVPPVPPEPPQSPRQQPTNALVTAMLTDMYQITMAYAYWKNNKHDDPAVFELFFRKNPFDGEFTIFAGLDECLAHINNFCFTFSDVEYLKTVPALRHCDAAFFEWLLKDANLKTNNSSNIKISAMRDGTICFPRVPLITIQAPLAIGQLLETTLLTLVNYPSLITTNAARMVHAVSQKRNSTSTTSTTSTSTSATLTRDNKLLPPQALKIPTCVEFGLRRAQGPDGGMSASKYSQMGGFAGTSNVQAGKLFRNDNIQLTGTHAHAFVQSFASLNEVHHVKLLPFVYNNNNNNNDNKDKEMVELLPRVLEYRRKAATLVPPPPTTTTTTTTTPPPVSTTTNDGELAAFIAYAGAFPHSFLCLIDTYDTLSSGLWNFIFVALVLDDLGYKPMGIRLDSGNLAALSMSCAHTFLRVGQHLNRCERFTNDLAIVASDDLNEAKLLQHSTSSNGCAITSYGIGTNLVTCQAQPALGCVYKLVQLNGLPRIKLSQDFGKILIPGHKQAYRLYDQNNVPILDIMTLVPNNGKEQEEEESDIFDNPPMAGQAIVCRDAFNGHKRVRVIPSRVEPLHVVVFNNNNATSSSSSHDDDNNNSVQPNRTLQQAKVAVQEQMMQMQSLGIFQFENPKPYKVAVSERLYMFMNDLWQREAPMKELS